MKFVEPLIVQILLFNNDFRVVPGLFLIEVISPNSNAYKKARTKIGGASKKIWGSKFKETRGHGTLYELINAFEIRQIAINYKGHIRIGAHFLCIDKMKNNL